jgi:two-component system chemotaxis response regulator CheY
MSTHPEHSASVTGAGTVPGSDAPSERPSQSILVVVDDQGIRKTVREALDFEGYRVLTAANGSDALTVLDRECPALILLDLRLPILDGWGFARALQQRELKFPAIVMTAATDARQWAADIGAIGYLAKPFELVDLLSAVEDGLLG